MPVTIDLRKEELAITDTKDLTVSKVLQRLGLVAETHLVTRSGELLTEHELIRDGDRLRIIPVISGGRQ